MSVFQCLGISYVLCNCDFVWEKMGMFASHYLVWPVAKSNETDVLIMGLISNRSPVSWEHWSRSILLSVP